MAVSCQRLCAWMQPALARHCRAQSSCAQASTTISDPGPAINLIGMPREQMVNAIQSRTTLSFAAATELYKRIYRHGLANVHDFDFLSERRRLELTDVVDIRGTTISKRTLSSDGTVKWLMRVADGFSVETVFIPEVSSEGVRRGVLCVSSQVGCSLSCTFCRTGTQKPGRNLSSADIVGQFLAAQADLNAMAGSTPTPALDTTAAAREITNVVFMGQGEPLYNFRNVSAAVQIFTDTLGLNIAPRRVTISTSGVAPLMARVGTELKASLALSLHAPTDELRSQLMNINKSYPLVQVMAGCRDYAASKTGAPRRMLWEYTMLQSVNDSLTHAQQVLDLIQANKLAVAVNLIPFNPWPGTSYVPSGPETIDTFAKFLLSRGVLATIRWPRGRDILAACGQLNSEGAGTDASPAS